MAVAAQNVIDALKGSYYIPRVHRIQHGQPCLSIAIPRSTDMLDLAAKLIDGGLYTDYLAELGLTMLIDRTGLYIILYWPQLLLEPDQVQALAGRIEENNDFAHYV
jgi:hypothetical protein